MKRVLSVLLLLVLLLSVVLTACDDEIPKLIDGSESETQNIIDNAEGETKATEEGEAVNTDKANEAKSYTVKLYTYGGTFKNLENMTKYSTVGNEKTSYYEVRYKGNQDLPTPINGSADFEGWYTTANFSGKAVKSVSKETVLYAKWSLTKAAAALEHVSDNATAGKEDVLPLNDANVISYQYISSNPALYTISNGKGVVNKIKQTHKEQTVTVSVKATLKDGSMETSSKEITVAPIEFEQISSTPVATYFASSARYAYESSTRYKTEGTYFSNSTRQTLDIVYWAFARIGSNGTVVVDTLNDANNASVLAELQEMRANNDVRLVLCIAGTSTAESKLFRTVTADDTLRAAFVKNLMDTVEKYNFDGIDIDWESANSTDAAVVASGMNALMRDLRAEMNKRQGKGGSPYLLTTAIPASSWGMSDSRFDIAELNKYVDYVNLMSYDMNKTNLTTHLSPLYKSQKDNGYGFGCVYGAELLISKGLDKNKIIIGSAGYGKAYSVTGTLNSGTHTALGVSGTLTAISGISGSFASGTVFGNGIQQLINSGKYTVYTEYDSNGRLVGSYLYSATDKIFVTYDSADAIKAKYNYAKAQGFGIMCWSYTEDVSDTFVNAVHQAKKS